MKTLVIFGNSTSIVEKRDGKDDSAALKGNKLIINSSKKPTDLILKELLPRLLRSKLREVYDEIKQDGKIEVFGDLDFTIVERIDGKRGRIAKLVGRNVLVKLNAVILPKNALKYVIAHEMAHTITKKHGKSYWKLVETIYPKCEQGRLLLAEYKESLSAPILYS